MKKRCVIVFLLLFLISNVMAYESTISVKTGIPNQEIIFKACDPSTGKTLPGGDFQQKSDGGGKVVFNYNLEPLLIKMSFMAWSGSGYSTFLNGKQAIFLNNVILDEFVDVDLNKAVPSFKAYSNESEEVTGNVAAEVEVAGGANTTASNDTTTPNLTTEVQVEELFETQNTGLTGAVISRGKEIFSSAKTYLILVGILVLVGGFIIIKKRGVGIKKANRFIVTKLSEMRASKGDRNNELESAERKLKEVQKELEDLKNKKNKIREVQERLKKDKEELKRLGGTE